MIYKLRASGLRMGVYLFFGVLALSLPSCLIPSDLSTQSGGGDGVPIEGVVWLPPRTLDLRAAFWVEDERHLAIFTFDGGAYNKPPPYWEPSMPEGLVPPSVPPPAPPPPSVPPSGPRPLASLAPSLATTHAESLPELKLDQAMRLIVLRKTEVSDHYLVLLNEPVANADKVGQEAPRSANIVVQFLSVGLSRDEVIVQFKFDQRTDSIVGEAKYSEGVVTAPQSFFRGKTVAPNGTPLTKPDGTPLNGYMQPGIEYFGQKFALDTDAATASAWCQLNDSKYKSGAVHVSGLPFLMNLPRVAWNGSDWVVRHADTPYGFIFECQP